MTPREEVKASISQLYDKYYGKSKANQSGARLGLKSIIREEVKRGKSKEEIVEYLVRRNTGKTEAQLKKYVRYIVDYRLQKDK